MEYLIPPWAHQLKAIELASQQDNFGFFFEMGAGKTATTINTIRQTWNVKKRLPRCLIFCPPIVIENWRQEWLKNSKISPDKITCLYGPGRTRNTIFQRYGFEWHEDGTRGGAVPHIFITNYESLGMRDLFDQFWAWSPEVVVFDEIHRLKSFKANRSKLAENLVNGRMRLTGPNKLFQHLEGPRPIVYGLSGSPILNTAMDIFNIYKILDAGRTFGSNFFAFRNRYFHDKNQGMNKQNYFPNWQPIPGAMEDIARKMTYNSMRVLKKDCMDLPPLVRKKILIPMAPEQRRIYDSMLKDYVALFDMLGAEHTASAVLAITKGLRLMQLASGFVKTVDEAEMAVTEGWNGKQQALHDLLEELTPNHKVVIWTVWRQTYEQIRAVLDELKIDFVEVHGDVKDKQKYSNVDRFNTDSRCRVLLGHPGSGGIGINLVAASYAIFYSRNFSLEHDIQAEARNYRGGSEIHEKVTRIDLVTQDSIEEKILERLASKQEIGNTILRDITMELGGKNATTRIV